MLLLQFFWQTPRKIQKKNSEDKKRESRCWWSCVLQSSDQKPTDESCPPSANPAHTSDSESFRITLITKLWIAEYNSAEVMRLQTLYSLIIVSKIILKHSQTWVMCIWTHVSQSSARLGGGYGLFDDGFRSRALVRSCCRWITDVTVSAEASGSVGKTVCRDVFLVSLANNAEGSGVGVRDVRDGVAIQRGFMGNGTHLLNGLRRAGASRLREGGVKRIIVAEGDVSAWAQRPRPLCRGRGSGCGLGRVLVQPITGDGESNYQVSYSLEAVLIPLVLILCN